MDKIITMRMPEAMVSSIAHLSKDKNCSINTVIKLAIAKFLFDQTLPEPEICQTTAPVADSGNLDDISNQLPLDRIVSVQYTLDDGRVIHIMRQSKIGGMSSKGTGSSRSVD